MHVESKNIGKPDETREMPNGRLELLNLTGMTLGRATFEPGWKWSESVKPIAGTDSCQVHHNGYIVSGRLHMRMDDGKELEVGPGDAFVCEAGHDAWVVGNEAVVALDFSGEMSQYAKQ